MKKRLFSFVLTALMIVTASINIHASNGSEESHNHEIDCSYEINEHNNGTPISLLSVEEFETLFNKQPSGIMPFGIWCSYCGVPYEWLDLAVEVHDWTVSTGVCNKIDVYQVNGCPSCGIMFDNRLIGTFPGCSADHRKG